jgi:NAD+ synthase (glutamine-hydrolysing)
MPSRYSSEHSVADARALAENLGIEFSVINIEPMHAAFEQALAPHFAGSESGVTEENIQARARGVLLMALSNKFGSLLLTTGNKSEVAVG